MSIRAPNILYSALLASLEAHFQARSHTACSKLGNYQASAICRSRACRCLSDFLISTIRTPQSKSTR